MCVPRTGSFCGSEEPDCLSSLCLEKQHFSLVLHISLEDPMDGGAWWAAVHGVAGVGRDWETSLSLVTFMPWRERWRPTPVFLPGESQGRGSLVGCHIWGRTESDTTEAT